MLKHIISGILGGLMVGLGGVVYLSVDVKYIGAVLFTIALLAICLKGYGLFTGKVGYMAIKHDRYAWTQLCGVLIGNAIATVAVGLVMRYAQPAIIEKAVTLCNAKLAQAYPAALIRAIFCGILMYLAVSTYYEKNSFFGVLWCVPVFILSGYEHSIANMFYFSAAGMFGVSTLVYLVIIIIGNSIGGMLLPVLEKLSKEN